MPNFKARNTQRKILQAEEPLYRKLFNELDRLPNGTKIALSGYGGEVEFPNSSKIKFIPHFEKDREQELRKANSAYMIKEFLKKNNLNQPLKDLLDIVDDFVKQNY